MTKQRRLRPSQGGKMLGPVGTAPEGRWTCGGEKETPHLPSGAVVGPRPDPVEAANQLQRNLDALHRAFGLLVDHIGLRRRPLLYEQLPDFVREELQRLKAQEEAQEVEALVDPDRLANAMLAYANENAEVDIDDFVGPSRPGRWLSAREFVDVFVDVEPAEEPTGFIRATGVIDKELAECVHDDLKRDMAQRPMYSLNLPEGLVKYRVKQAPEVIPGDGAALLHTTHNYSSAVMFAKQVRCDACWTWIEDDKGAVYVAFDPAVTEDR